MKFRDPSPHGVHSSSPQLSRGVLHTLVFAPLCSALPRCSPVGRNGNVLVSAIEEASLGLEPNVVMARASLLAGLSQCILRYTLEHINVALKDA